MRSTRGDCVRTMPLAIGAGLLVASLLNAPRCNADATDTLAGLIGAARGHCAPLQIDPVLTGLAQRANRETHQYQEHAARFEPFEDPMPVLRDLGYAASKAKMFSGYGGADAQAMRSVVLFGWEAIPDCSYTKYGVDVLAGTGYTTATAVLAAP